MSTTVLAPSGFEISSNHEDGQAMLDSLTKTEDKTPRVLVDKGEPVNPAKDGDETSQAASVLGKKGGKAAAEARKAEAKAKPADEKPEAKEAKPGDAKGKDEQATKGKAEGDEKDEPAAEPAKDKRGDPRLDSQARIAELARERREAREEADRLRRELAEARRAPARQDAPPARDARPAAAQDDRAHEDPSDPKPKLADFEDYEQFTEALSRWGARDENRKVQHRQAHEDGHRKFKEHIQGAVDTFHERVTGLKKDDAGQGEAFATFMDSLPEEILAPTSFQLADYAAQTNQPHLRPGPKNLITDLIVKSDNPKGLFEHFAENRDDYQRIATLRTRDEIIAEMAILSHRLHAVTADTSDKREVSRAGSPGKSVPGSPRAADPNLSSMGFEEHMRAKASARK